MHVSLIADNQGQYSYYSHLIIMSSDKQRRLSDNRGGDFNPTPLIIRQGGDFNPNSSIFHDVWADTFGS